jgi:hypothetical protein
MDGDGSSSADGSSGLHLAEGDPQAGSPSSAPEPEPEPETEVGSLASSAAAPPQQQPANASPPDDDGSLWAKQRVSEQRRLAQEQEDEILNRTVLAAEHPKAAQFHKNHADIVAILSTANCKHVDISEVGEELFNFEVQAQAVVHVAEAARNVTSCISRALFSAQLATNSVIMVLGQLMGGNSDAEEPGPNIDDVLMSENATDADFGAAAFGELDSVSGGDAAILAAKITAILGLANAFMKGLDAKFQPEVKEDQLHAKITRIKVVVAQLQSLQSEVILAWKMCAKLKEEDSTGPPLRLNNWKLHHDPWAGESTPKVEECVEYVRTVVAVKKKVDNWKENVWEPTVKEAFAGLNTKKYNKKVEELEQKLNEEKAKRKEHQKQKAAADREAAAKAVAGGKANGCGTRALEGIYTMKLSEVKALARNVNVDSVRIDDCDDHENDTKDMVRTCVQPTIAFQLKCWRLHYLLARMSKSVATLYSECLRACVCGCGCSSSVRFCKRCFMMRSCLSRNRSIV